MTQQKSPRPNGLAASFLVDIPTRWEPRTNQSPTGALIAFAALGTCCSRPVPPTTKNPQTKWPGDHGGALSTAGEPLSRHIIAAVRALQTKKRRHLGTLQPLLACFFQLIFVQSNAVQQITLILGGCIIIDSEPFADSTELVKHFNSSRDIRLISISIKTPFPKNVRARTVPWPKIFNS